jgi:hypothetical protein
MPILGSIIRKAYELRQFPIDFTTQDPVREQQRVLKKLLTRAVDTSFGSYYGFAGMIGKSDPLPYFRSQVPVHDYNSMFKSWWYRSLNGEPYVTWPGRVKYFALTSGTSEASSKQIPVTSDMLRAIKKASIRQLVSTTKYGFPNEFYEKGALMIGGSTHLQYNGTYYQGDLSGITAKNIPFWFQHFYKPGKRISRESEWSVKLNDIVENAGQWDIGIIVGVPAWIQIILEKVIDRYKIHSIHDIWPNLSVYVHSGVSFAPYVKSFEKLFGKPVLFNESYLASEGYIAYQQPWNKTGMELITDNGIFYEFIPFNEQNFDNDGELKPNPETFTLSEITPGKEYAILLSTCAGAWRYLIGDTVKFIPGSNAELVLTGRTKHFISLCGEHLSQDNLNRAIRMLQDELNVKISEFTITGIRVGNLFGHQWYLGTDDPLSTELASQLLDHYLQILNDDYRVERIEAIRTVRADVLPLQAFRDWMKVRGKEGGAHKFPRVLNTSQHEEWMKHIEPYKLTQVP